MANEAHILVGLKSLSNRRGTLPLTEKGCLLKGLRGVWTCTQKMGQSR